MTDLAQQIKALVEKATEGPWNVDGPPNNQIIWSSPEERVCFMAHSDGKDEERDIATAALIVLLRNNVDQILTALSEAERMREALERAIGFVEAVADSDPDEQIADNGMTVLGKLQFDAPVLIFKMRAAIGGE